MGFQGMDVPQARKLSGHMREGAQRIEGMVAGVAAMLANVTWTGPDGQRFQEDWSGMFGPQLRAQTTEVHEQATQLSRRADAQEAASGS
jgi:uncharacterized protein YukE